MISFQLTILVDVFMPIRMYGIHAQSDLKNSKDLL